MKPFVKTFIVTADNGGIKFQSDHQHLLWKDALKKLDGKQVRIELTTKQLTRTQQQNKFYWLYLQVIAEETGNDIETLHCWAKGKFLTESICEVFGDKVRRVKSTTELSKNDFAEFMEKISGETGVPIPNVEDWLYGPLKTN